MGESVSEATITNWLKSVGDTVSVDESIVEVATDKVDSDVPSPVGGVLKAIFFDANQVAQVGDVLAIIEVESSGEDAPKVDTADAQQPAEVEESKVEVDEDQILQVPGVELLPDSEGAGADLEASDVSAEWSSDRFYSPLVRNIAKQEGISSSELASIHGSGAEGRVTKQDILSYLARKGGSSAEEVVRPTVAEATPGKPDVAATSHSAAQPTAAAQVVRAENGDEIIEMDRMRRLIADHMVHSVKTSPHVFSVVETDVTNLVLWRNKVKDSYKKREGENITFTPLIIEAISKALRDFPMINVSVDGNRIIKRKNINIGMAAALPTGNLIVPVIKNADQLSLVGISKAVNDLAVRARGNKLKPDDTQGGTFTFTNIGAFGNILGMPIINQPQAAILAVGTIKKKPAVIETPQGDLIGIRHFMYITMSYDHRVIDGALGGTFIKRVSDYLENWDVDREI